MNIADAKERAEKELIYTYFNEYLFKNKLITKEQKEKMDKTIAKI